MKKKQMLNRLRELGAYLHEYLSQGLDFLLSKLEGAKHELGAKFDKENTILSKNNKGFNLTGKSISPKLSEQGVLVVGGTGTGKSSVAIIRSILTVKGNNFINDPSRELIEKTGGCLQEKGVNVIPFDVHTPNGIYFNPLKRCSNNAELNQLSFQLMKTASSKKDFWSQSASQLLTIIFRTVKQMSEGYQNLYNAYHLLDQISQEDGKIKVGKFIAIISEKDPSLYDNYLALISGGKDTVAGIIASARTAIQQYALDEKLAMITSKDTIGDFAKLRKGPTAIFIHSSTTKGEYYSGIVSIFTSQYFDNYFSKLPEENDIPTFYHLDEIPLLKGLDNLDSIAANLRKYNPEGGLMILCQDIKQIETNYGREKAATILSNLRTKLFLSASPDTAQKLSNELGKYQFKDPKTDRNQIRSLMTIDEIMTIPDDRGLITIAGKRPIIANLMPYYKSKSVLRLTEAPYEEHQPLEIVVPKLFNIDQFIKEWEQRIGLTPKTKK